MNLWISAVKSFLSDGAFMTTTGDKAAGDNEYFQLFCIMINY